MTTQYRFVPDYIANLVDEVCKSNDLTCLDIRKDGAFSGYFASISDGSTTIEKFLPYDYGMMLPASERPALLVNELAKALNLSPTKTAEKSNGNDTAVIDDTPEVPHRPAKRGKK